jgi:predicted transcriptional regulator of viral defense system
LLKSVAVISIFGKQMSLISTVQTLREHNLFAFTSRTFADLLGIDAVQAARTLTRMEAENLVARPLRGRYILLGLESEQVLSNHLFIGSHLTTPTYVSFWSALHYYGFTEQVPQTVFLAVARKERPLVFQGVTYKFVKLKPIQYFGYRREMHGNMPIVVANEPKAIVDSLHRPEYAGGVAEVAKALRNALGQVEIAELVAYANAMRNRSLGSRLGYLLELLGVEVDGLDISQGPVNLEPGKPRGGEYQSRWRVYVNLPVKALFPEGVG